MSLVSAVSRLDRPKDGESGGVVSAVSAVSRVEREGDAAGREVSRLAELRLKASQPICSPAGIQPLRPAPQNSDN